MECQPFSGNFRSARRISFGCASPRRPVRARVMAHGPEMAIVSEAKAALPGPYDVAVVGYGPVGQMLAILLGQRGWKVGVFEKRPAPYPMPRAVHFDHEIGRIFQAAGIAKDLAGRTEPAPIYEWRNA